MLTCRSSSGSLRVSSSAAADLKHRERGEAGRIGDSHAVEVGQTPLDRDGLTGICLVHDRCVVYRREEPVNVYCTL